MNLENQILEELEKSPLLKALISAAPEHAIIFDLEGTVQAFNERMGIFLSKNPKISFSINDENRNICQIAELNHNCCNIKKCKFCLFQVLIAESMKTREAILNREGFLNIFDEDGIKKISIIFNVFPFEYEENAYIIFGFRDIDSIKEYERKRINDLKKLSIIGESVASIVHDLKNPLTGLFGYLELMRIKENKMDLIPKMQKALEIIRTTLEDVLSITYDKDELIISKKNEDIRDIVIETISLLSIEDITRVEIKGNTTVLIDRIKFHNVLWNLLKNASEALINEEDEILIKLYKENKYLIIEVNDTGKGIPNNLKDQLFMPGRTFGKNNGTGFGLYNAKKIVEAHGGEISFFSEVGKGTSFLIKIPNDS